MKKDIHPAYEPLMVKCICGNNFQTRSTLKQKTLHLEKCPQCHPFYNPKQNSAPQTGRRKAYQDKFPGLNISHSSQPVNTTN